MPPNFRDLFRFLTGSGRRRLPRSFHRHWLAVGLGLAGISAQAQTLERPSPTDKSGLVPANPVLTWTYGTGNLLSNGGFEEGTNGWAVGRATVVSQTTVEGTHLLTGKDGYVVQRDLLLPGLPGTLNSSGGGLSLSFQARLLTPGLEVSLEFPDAVRPPVTLPITANYLAGKWRNFGADLSAYAGHSVRLKWVFPPADQVAWYMDDVRLTWVPGGAEFEVWFSTNSVAQLTRLGRTAVPSWPIHFLPAGRQCYWRVDVVGRGQTNIGPVWSFQTAQFVELTQVVVDPLPELICDRQPLQLGLQLTDENGFPGLASGRTYNVTSRVDVLGEGVPPPPVVVTELSLSPEAAEFQNVSDRLLDLSGWFVDVLHIDDRTNARVRLRIPEGSTLAPGGLFQAQMRSPGATAWPVLRSPQAVNWTGGSRAAVVFRDPASNVVDCVFFERFAVPTTDGSRTGLQTGSVPRPEWPGLPVTNAVPAGQTLQRTGGRDRNSAADWRFATATLGRTNAELTLPFERGVGSVPAAIPAGSVRTDANGRFTLPVQLTGPASNAVLFATASIVNSKVSYGGQSTPFQLSGDVCLEVSVPPDLSETAGDLAEGVRVSIPSPHDTNVVVRLQLPGGVEEGVTLPAELIIRAGATEATGHLRVTDNAELTGPRSLLLTATADGFAQAGTPLVVQDDERATLRLGLPPSVAENSSADGTLFITPPPSRPVTVTLEAGAAGRLGFATGEAGLIPVPGGAAQVPVHLWALDNHRLEGPTNVTVRAGFADWTPAVATLQIGDDETNTITVQAPAEVEEGDSNIGIRVVLGGTVDTNVVLNVTVEPGNRVTPELQTTVPAGQQELGIRLYAGDGTGTEGDMVVTIRTSAPGWQDGVTTMRLLDNDPARFAVHVPKGPVQAGETFTMRLRYENLNGRPLPTRKPDAPTATVVGFGTAPVYLKFCTNCATPPDEGFDVLFAIDRPSPAAVVRVEAEGAVGDSDPLLVWGDPVPTALLDGVYDELRDRLVLATQSDAIRAIDPATGDRHEITPFGRAYLTALADDRETLYLALLDGSRGVARANLASLSSEALWLTEPGETASGAPVLDLLPLPGQPRSVLVAQRSGEAELTLTVYDDTVPRQESAILPIPAFTGAALLPGLLSGQVFVSTLDAVTEFSVTANGVVRVPSAWESRHTYDGGDPATSVSSQGLLLDAHGELFDPALPGWAGDNPPDFLSNRFATDPHTGRIAWQHAGDQASFRILDPLTLREVWRSGEGEPTPLLFWAGPHRWVTQTQNRMLFITDNAPDPLPATDLAVTASVIARDPQAVRATARWRIENRGTNPAPDVRLTFALPRKDWRKPAAIALLSLSSNAVPTTNGLGGRSFMLGDLAPGAAAEITAEFRAFEDGRLDASAFVGSSAADPDPKNNRAAIHAEGLTPTLSLRVTEPPAVGAIPLEFPTLAGWNFEVQWARTVNGPWESGLAPVMGTGDTKTLFVEAGSDTARYWRVVLRLP